MRRQSHWLALAVSFLILASVISLTLLFPLGSLAFEDQTASPLLGGYQSSQRCRECHEAEFLSVSISDIIAIYGFNLMAMMFGVARRPKLALRQ